MAIDRPGPATLGDMADQGMDVWAWCNGCFKNGAVATDALIARLGSAYPVPDVGAGCTVHAAAATSRRDRTGRTMWA